MYLKLLIEVMPGTCFCFTFLFGTIHIRIQPNIRIWLNNV